MKLTYSSYIGGRTGGFTMIRDVATDALGNVYITGGTASTDFPTTPGVYDRSFNGGPMDVFVLKLDSRGRIVWSTYLGGPEYDRAYAIEVDRNGFVYVAGRAGRSFPVTSSAFQPRFEGWSGGEPYRRQNAFVAKLKPDGSGLQWASYFGAGQLIRDLDLDRQGNIFVHSCTGLDGAPYSATNWFSNAFQCTPLGADDTVVAKIKSDGSQVIWATYLGGASSEGSSGSIRVNPLGEVYSLSVTSSTDMPTTPGAYQRTHAPGVERDFHLARLSRDGSRLIFGTYLGGSAHEQYETHNLAIDAQGNAIVAAGTTSTDFPTTRGVYDRTFNGSGYPHGNYPGDVVVAKISADGTTLLASTFFGGTLGESVEGVAVDKSGNIYVTGATGSSDLPTTPGAFQLRLKGAVDAFVVKFSPDLRQVFYSSYIGGGAGKGNDYCRCAALDPTGSLVIAGETNSTDWPAVNGLKSGFPAAPFAKFSATSAPAPGQWRRLPLITDGKIDAAWAQVGWGGFAVDAGALRTECDDRGMGLLLYKPEKFGDCQIRVVYRCEKPTSNAGVFVRIDDGVLARIGEKPPEVHRDAKGKLSPQMIDRLKQASERHLGGWYPVHHGYEVQICDADDPWHRTGAIYSLSKAAGVPEKPRSYWRTMIITLDGERITVHVDGKRLSSFDPTAADNPPRKQWFEPTRRRKRPTRGYLGLQNHDPGDVVWFREVSVRPLGGAK